MDIPFTKSKKGIILRVRVETKTSKSCISGIYNNFLKVKLHSPPINGEANKELIELLSEAFSLKKSSIKIIKGISSKEKLIEIEGVSFITLRKGEPNSA
jgi:uncharacterized protein (TIGR00251 family)